MADNPPLNDPTSHLTGREYRLGPDSSSTQPEAPAEKTRPQRPTYILSEKGHLVPVLANAVAMITSSLETKNLFKKNVFLDEVFVFGNLPGEEHMQQSRALSDEIVRDLTTWVQVQGLLVPSKLMHEAVLTVAEKDKFHPVRDYLNSLQWDGHARVDTMFVRYGAAKDCEYLRAVSRRWMIQAIARIYEPGCKGDTMIVLEGEQGLQKSTLLRILGGDWFTDSLPNIRTKDASIALRGVW